MVNPRRAPWMPEAMTTAVAVIGHAATRGALPQVEALVQALEPDERDHVLIALAYMLAKEWVDQLGPDVPADAFRVVAHRIRHGHDDTPIDQEDNNE